MKRQTIKVIYKDWSYYTFNKAGLGNVVNEFIQILSHVKVTQQGLIDWRNPKLGTVKEVVTTHTVTQVNINLIDHIVYKDGCGNIHKIKGEDL